MNRATICALTLAVAGLAPVPAVWAQDGATGSPPERIDLTITQEPARISEECRRRQEAAVVSREIVVCGSADREEAARAAREEAQRRYAERTAFRDQPATPDVAGAGIFRGPATVSGICVKGILNCPKPPALVVDVTRLPQAPPGSDADRLSRGLPAIGSDGGVARALSAAERAELGLPDPPPASPAVSASPAAPQ